MKPANWAWWTTDRGTHRLVHRLHIALGVAGAVLLLLLVWVLATPVDEGPGARILTATERCLEQPREVLYRRVALAPFLEAPPPTDQNCWLPAALPHFGTSDRSEFPALVVPLSRAWYRFQYEVPPDWPTGEELMLHIPRIMASAWLLRVNGEIHAHNLEDWRMTWNQPVNVRLPAALVTPGVPVEFQLAVAYMPEANHSLAPIIMGPASVVGREATRRDFLQHTTPEAGALMLLFIGAFFFAFWLCRPQESAHLLLALASLAWAICNLQYILPRVDDPHMDSWYCAIINASVTWFIWLVLRFALRFDSRRFPWVESLLPAYVLTMTVAGLPLWAPDLDWGILFQTLNAGVAIVVTLLLVWMAVRGGSVEIRVIAAALTLATASGAHDVALVAQMISPEDIYLLPYGGMLVFGAFLFAMQRRYVTAINGYESLSSSLARQLAAREGELIENHRRLAELERAQALDAERKRLMRDMHDGLGSALTASLVAVERGRAAPEQMVGMLRECVDELRMVIDSLAPEDHDLVGLLATLRFRMGRRLDLAGIALDWEIDDLPPLAWLGPPEILQVLRILQEILVNVIKHANATRVRVATRALPEYVEVSCEDDGCGFDASRPRPGRGLPSLRERAARLGGFLHFEAGQSGGTRVSLWLPRSCPGTNANTSTNASASAG